MKEKTFCICKNKGTDSSDHKLMFIQLNDSAFVSITQIVQFLYFLNPKCPASSHLLCLYSLVCVGPVWGKILLVFS